MIQVVVTVKSSLVMNVLRKVVKLNAEMIFWWVFKSANTNKEKNTLDVIIANCKRVIIIFQILQIQITTISLHQFVETESE
jgi:hypothetical protein